MSNSSTVSSRTRKNWWVDAGLALSGVVAALSGVYFLALPTGGYRGGRNPYYGVQILFARATWDDLHTWFGAAMIAIAAVHLVIHWNWVTAMVRRIWNELNGRCGCMNARGRWVLVLNTVVAISFVLTALSGMYFLFAPGGHAAAAPAFLFSRTTWDLIHTWAGVTFIAAAVIHFAIHWRWVVNVTGKIAAAVLPGRPATAPAAAPRQTA